MNDNVSLELTSTPGQVRSACAALTALCEGSGISREAGYPLELCLSEALNNILQHAFDYEVNHRINVTMTVQRKRVVMEITYCSPKILTTEHFVKAQLPDAELLPEGGFGNYLLSRLMDRVRVTHEGDATHLLLEKALT